MAMLPGYLLPQIPVLCHLGQARKWLEVVYLSHHQIPEGSMETVYPESIGLSSARLERLNVILHQYTPPFTIPTVEEFAQLAYQALE